MFQLLKTVPVPELLARQLPVFLLSFVIAELFYKFHSFTLEAGAFLVTWFVLDWLYSLVAPRLGLSPVRKE